MGKILTFYQAGAGSSNYWIPERQPVLSEEDWAKKRHAAIALLRQRGHPEAAEILESHDLSICRGDNSFGDDFNVLYREVGVEEYVAYDEKSRSPEFCDACRQVARALSDLGAHVRFIGVELVPKEAVEPVPPPQPKVTSAAVEAALADAQQMVVQNRPVSGVDRAHTSLHGYLKQLCNDAQLPLASQESSILDFIKTLAKHHPKFAAPAPYQAEAEKIIKAFGTVCDALNPVRNRGSLAHANESLLDDPEAMLAINASRTILHYIQQKVEA